MNSREEPRRARVKNGMDLSQDVDLTRIFPLLRQSDSLCFSFPPLHPSMPTLPNKVLILPLKQNQGSGFKGIFAMLSFSEPRGEYTVNVTPKYIDDVMV